MMAIIIICVMASVLINVKKIMLISCSGIYAYMCGDNC